MPVTQAYKNVNLSLTRDEHLHVLSALFERERELLDLLKHENAVSAYWARQLDLVRAVIAKVSV